LQYIDTLSISKRDFYAQTGISRGTLESNTGITEDTVAKFIAFYPNISPNWLLTGAGPQNLSDIKIFANSTEEGSQGAENSGCEMCKLKDRLIDSQQKQIETLSRLISMLDEKNNTI